MHRRRHRGAADAPGAHEPHQCRGDPRQPQGAQAGAPARSCRTPATTSASTSCPPRPTAWRGSTPRPASRTPRTGPPASTSSSDLLEQHQPKVVLCPHDRDWNSTHIGTHYLVMDALKQMPAGFTCYVVETEFWGAMTDPNLMVEISAEDLADMIAATTFHVGEVNRNPYHLLLPPWMMDNVRRGGEVVGGQGGSRARLRLCSALPPAQVEPGPAGHLLRGRQAGSVVHEHRRPVSLGLLAGRPRRAGSKAGEVPCADAQPNPNPRRRGRPLPRCGWVCCWQ